MFQCFTRSIGAHDPAHHQTAHNQWLNKIYQNVRLQRHILLWATSNKPVIMQLCFSKRQYSLYMTNSTKFVNRPIEWHAPITIISYLEEQSMTFSIYKYNTITHKLPCRLYLLKSELPPNIFHPTFAFINVHLTFDCHILCVITFCNAKK
jgi:hypothetical protein